MAGNKIVLAIFHFNKKKKRASLEKRRTISTSVLNCSLQNFLLVCINVNTSNDQILTRSVDLPPINQLLERRKILPCTIDCK